MRTKLSTCLRKTQFLTRRGAEQFADLRLLMGQSAYRCNQCKHWHLTSKLPNKRAALAGEAGTAATVKQDAVHEHATAKPERPTVPAILPNKERPR